MFLEKLKEANSYGEKLEKAERHAVDDVKVLEKIVPEKIGVYLWRCKKDSQIVYIGQALGEGGLRQRIIRQHLNKSYYGKDKEKSAFRKYVAETEKQERDEVVPFIKVNYTLSFITFPTEDKRLANFVEKLLQFEYETRYEKYKTIRSDFLKTQSNKVLG